MKPLRILSYNIHGGYDVRGNRDLARIRALMDDHGIDIALFQEMETRPSRGGAATDINTIAGDARPHHFPGLTLSEEGGGWYGNLIVSKYPILRGIVHDLETHPSREPRNAVDALIETPLGNLRVIGTHLSLSPLERWSEVRNLTHLIDRVEEAEKNPLLLAGDINEWRGSAKLLRHLSDIMTPLPVAKSFPSRWPLLHLDRAWIDKWNGSARAKVLKTPATRQLSDHLPVMIELS